MKRFNRAIAVRRDDGNVPTMATLRAGDTVRMEYVTDAGEEAHHYVVGAGETVAEFVARVRAAHSAFVNSPAPQVAGDGAVVNVGIAAGDGEPPAP